MKTASTWCLDYIWRTKDFVNDYVQWRDSVFSRCPRRVQKYGFLFPASANKTITQTNTSIHFRHSACQKRKWCCGAERIKRAERKHNKTSWTTGGVLKRAGATTCKHENTIRSKNPDGSLSTRLGVAFTHRPSYPVSLQRDRCMRIYSLVFWMKRKIPARTTHYKIKWWWECNPDSPDRRIKSELSLWARRSGFDNLHFRFPGSLRISVIDAVCHPPPEKHADVHL